MIQWSNVYAGQCLSDEVDGRYQQTNKHLGTNAGHLISMKLEKKQHTKTRKQNSIGQKMNQHWPDCHAIHHHYHPHPDQPMVCRSASFWVGSWCRPRHRPGHWPRHAGAENSNKHKSTFLQWIMRIKMMTTCVDGDLPRHSLSPVHGDGVHGGGCGNTQITFIMTMVAMPVMMMIQVYKMHLLGQQISSNIFNMYNIFIKHHTQV